VTDRAPGQVVVLADDLIWSTRLAALVRGAGAEVVPVATTAAFEAALPGAERVIVDLTARGYDGLAAVARAASTGRPVLCLAQHDDHELRRRALAAGAGRVYAYRKLAQDGPAVIGAWLGRPEQTRVAR
jgi:CheY-like chemotaxis protein